MAHRILGVVTSIVVLIIASYFYVVVRSFGFPDGHVTELERAREPLYITFILLSVLHGAIFFVISFTAVGTRLVQLLLRVGAVYVVCVVTIFAVDTIFSFYLDHGVGG